MSSDSSHFEALQSIHSDVFTYEIILHRHPKGLRAFPPELRIIVFKNYFGSIKLSQQKAESSALLLALHHYDLVLYEEALLCYHGFAPVVTVGKWTPFDENPDAPCRWVGTEERVLSMSPEIMAVVKHLRVDHCPTWQPLFPWATEKRNANIYSLGTSFDLFLNISNLTINFKSWTSYRKDNGIGCNPHIFTSKGCYGHHNDQTSMLMAFYVVHPLMMKFPKLNKLSIVLQNENCMHCESTTGQPWWTGDQDKIVKAFENTTLEVITAALGVKPKLCGVRTSHRGSWGPRSTGELIIYSYRAMSRKKPLHGSSSQDGYIHDVEWFWAAEEGKTLSWDMEKANDQAEEFRLWISKEDRAYSPTSFSARCENFLERRRLKEELAAKRAR